MALLTDTGDVYTWRFAEGIEGEPFLAPYARVAPGTQIIESYDVPLTLFAWEPNGAFLAYTDSDCRDLRSPAVQPLQRIIVPPWTTMLLARTRAIFGGELVVDDWLVLR